MGKDEFVEMTFVQGGLLELMEICYVSNMDSITESESLKAELKILKEDIDEIQNSRNKIDDGTENQNDEIFALNSRETELKWEIKNIGEIFHLKIPVYSFSIATYPTTQDQWLEIMGNNPSHFKGKKNPVESIKWMDALEYCNRLSEKFGLEKVYEIVEDEITFEIIVKLIKSANGYRLPNHIQWLFAAKGGRKREEHSSYGYKPMDEPSSDKIGWFAESFDKDASFKAYFRKPETQPVGKKKSNELGIYDMLGNVNEMCWDTKWTYEYAKHIKQSIEQKIKLADTNGPESGDSVYALGCSWNTSYNYGNYDFFKLESYFRRLDVKYLIRKSESSDDIGFRVALPGDIR